MKDIQVLRDIIENIIRRIRNLERNEWAAGFVPYDHPTSFGDNPKEAHGTHSVIPLGIGDVCYIEDFTMPRLVGNLEEIILRYIPTGTGTWDYTIETSGGQCGEDEALNTDSMTADGAPVTDDQIQCLDITAAFTPYTANDTVGVKITCDALDTATVINIIGIRAR